jgi:hypothetical protein
LSCLAALEITAVVMDAQTNRPVAGFCSTGDFASSRLIICLSTPLHDGCDAPNMSNTMGTNFHPCKVHRWEYFLAFSDAALSSVGCDSAVGGMADCRSGLTTVTSMANGVVPNPDVTTMSMALA